VLIVFKKLWYELTNPRVEEEGWTTQEYLTRVIYTMVSLGLLIMTIIVPSIDYGVGEPSNEPTIIVAAMDFLILVGWFLIAKGRWRISSIFLPFVFLVPSGYMIFTVGPVTTAVLQLAIAVLLAGMLSGNRARWIMLLVCIVVYLVAGWGSGEHDVELFLTSGILLLVSLSGIALLDWFFSNMLNKSLRTVQEREAKLQSIFRAAPVGIGVVVDHVMQEVNHTLCQMTGYTRDELIEKSVRMLYESQEEHDAVDMETYPQADEQGARMVETHWICKDGAIRDVLLSSVPLDPKDFDRGQTFSALDITERKSFEQNLQAYATQLESLREVSLEITSQLNLDALLHFIAEKAIELLDGSQGGFYIYLPERNLLEWVIGVNSQVPVGTTIRRGEGLAGRVWENGAPMIVDDYQQWEGRAGIFEGFEFGATIEAPMYWKSVNGEDEFLGVLCINRENTFSDSDTNLLNLFATQAAIAIHNAQLYDLAQIEINERARAEVALRRRAEELASLQETVLEITLPHSLDELLKSIVERAVDLIGASGGGLYLADPELRQVRCVVSYNTQQDYTGIVLAYGEGAAGYVAQTGQPLLTDDYSSWWGRADIYEDDQPFHAVISTPLLWQGQVTGVLHLLRNISQKFTQEDLNLLTLFANHASVTVENARLYDSIAQELTERKRAEDALQKSEYLLKEAQKIAGMGHYNLDIRQGNWESSESLNRLFGIDWNYQTDIDGWLKIVRPEDRQAMAAYFTNEVVGKRQNFDKEYLITRINDGQERWVHGLGRLEYNERDEPIRMIGTIQDITERKQAERAMRAKTEELKALFSISSHLRMAQSADAMLPLVLSEMRRVLRSDANAVILLEQDKEHFRYALSDGPLAVNNGAQFDGEKSISGLILQTHQAYITNDLSSDSKKTTTLQGEDGLGPAVFVPVISESEFIGVLVCARNRGVDSQPYSTSEVQLLTAIGEMVGNALQRARLYDQAMTRLQHVQTLHSIDMAISANLDLSVILDVLLNQGTAQLNVDAACILLLNPNTHILEYAARNGFAAKEIKATQLRLGEGLPGRVAIDRKIMQVPDLSKSDDLVRRYLFEEGFVSYQAFPLIAKGQLQGVLEIFNRKPIAVNDEQTGFLETLATQAAIAIDNSQLFSDLQRSNFELEMAYDATIEGWSRALELRDQETEGHTLRVADMTIQLAQAMDVRGEELTHIRRGALLHDIGKMGVPDRILLKPGKLTTKEWKVMRQHTVYASDMLWPIEFLRPAIDIPYCHHERWDGTGYPRQLKGEQIPLSARLFAVADVWDALTNDRPYRKAWTKEKALDYITTNAGKHFDPRVVETFLALRNETAHS
jgi:PAS domain S-box-containing protein/putative nucleotidyltransferase with HDIG domain